MYENLTLEYSGEIAIIKFDRPKALNALNDATLLSLSKAIDEIGSSSEIRVVLLTGAGEKAFVAGADIAYMKDLTPLQARTFARFGQDVFRKLEMLAQPVIAVVNGYALGGGCELALACDIRLASEKAKFGQPEVSLGLTAGFGGTQRLERVVGAGVACELLFTGETIDAYEAQRIGLVNHVYPPDMLMEAALTMAHKIAKQAPQAVKMTKNAIQRGRSMDLDSALAYEADIFGLIASTADQKEGCQAFLDKRQPSFLNR